MCIGQNVNKQYNLPAGQLIQKIINNLCDTFKRSWVHSEEHVHIGNKAIRKCSNH